MTPPPVSTGFVKVSGQKFVIMMNSETYPLVGCVLLRAAESWHAGLTGNHCSANSYWVGLGGYSTDNMNQAFSDIAKVGGTTVRTW